MATDPLEKASFAQMDAIGQAVRSLGSADFYQSLLALVQAVSPENPVQVIYYSPFVPPRYICSFATPVKHQELYASKYYRLDPLYRGMFDQKTPSIVHLAVKRKERTEADDYFSMFFPQTKMADEIGLLLPTIGGGIVGVFVQSQAIFSDVEIARYSNLYEVCRALHDQQDRLVILSAKSGVATGNLDRSIVIFDELNREVFRSRDLARLAQLEPGFDAALREVVAKPTGSTHRLPNGLLHVQDLKDALASSPKGRICFFEHGPLAASPIDLSAEIDAFIAYYSLTARQSEIIKLALRGHPSSKIAKQLGLTQGTVRNHRKQIHAKMDVTTEREIFLAFFNYLATR